MSRDPGVWQRALLRAASGAVVVPVHGVVKASVVSPDRACFTSARRAAEQLALAQRLSAVYAWSCPACARIQDRADPQQCCARPRAMLAVALPERRHPLAHPAPPPGGSVAGWLSAAPSAPAGLSAPGLEDVAALAVRRLWDRLEAGAAVSAHDVVALLRLAREIEHDAARQGTGNDARWRATLKEVLWLVRRHLGEGWKPFAADLRASGALNLLWGPPPPRPARPAARL